MNYYTSHHCTAIENNTSNYTLTIAFSHALWNPGTIARLLFFHVSGSAGIRPFPITGLRISARMPV